MRKQEEQQLSQDQELVEEQAQGWRINRLKEMKEDDQRNWSNRAKTTGSRRKPEEDPGRMMKKKRLKYDLLQEDWGDAEDPGGVSSSTTTTVSVTVGGTDTHTNTPVLSPSTMAKRKQSRILEFMTRTPRPVVETPTKEEEVTIGSGRIADYVILEQTKKGGVIVVSDDENKDDELERMTIATKVISDSKGPNQDHVDEVMLTPSTRDEVSTVVCKPTKKGQCVLHGVMMKKLSVSSKKWCDRGGGRGYGWRTQKVTKYICTAKNNINNGPDIYTKEKFRILSVIRRLGLGTF